MYFLVLNKPDNTFDLELMKKISIHIDTVNNSKGPAVLVTIGIAGVFSKGLDVSKFKNDPLNAIHFTAAM